MPIFDFNNLVDKAKDLAQSGMSKSKQVADIAKLKWDNVVEEENIKKAFIEIGKLYYAERGMAPEPAYVALCEKITAAKVNIEENKRKIEECKAAYGVTDAEIETIIPVNEEPAEAPEAPADEPREEDPQTPPQE